MKWFLLISTIVICALIVVMGWIYVRNTDNKTELILDKSEVKKDTNAAVEAAKNLARDAEQGFDRLTADDEDAQASDPKRDSNSRPLDSDQVPEP